MRKIAIAAILASACRQDAGHHEQPQPRIEWAASEEGAFERAAREHRGVIAIAIASWAMQSHEMDELLQRDDLMVPLGDWVAYRYDVTAGDAAAQAWQEKHSAQTIPYVGFFRADGTELARIGQVVDRDELLRRVPRLR